MTPSDTTFQRVMERTDPASLERALERWTQPRVAASALAGDGKRIRGANRLSAAGQHWETVTLVDHSTGIPVASRSYREEQGFSMFANKGWLTKEDGGGLDKPVLGVR